MGVNGDLSKRDRLEVGLREAHVLTFHLILISTSYHWGRSGTKKEQTEHSALYEVDDSSTARHECICANCKMYLSGSQNVFGRSVYEVDDSTTAKPKRGLNQLNHQRHC